MRHELESGNWAEIRPVADLKARDKDVLTVVVRMRRQMDGDGALQAATPRELIGTEMAIRDALWAVCVTAWSFETPVPAWDEAAYEVKDSGVIGDLPLGDYAEIEALLTPHAELLLRRPDPKGTTISSSNGSSPARAAHHSRTGSARRTTGTSST